MCEAWLLSKWHFVYWKDQTERGNHVFKECLRKNDSRLIDLYDFSEKSTIYNRTDCVLYRARSDFNVFREQRKLNSFGNNVTFWTKNVPYYCVSYCIWFLVFTMKNACIMCNHFHPFQFADSRPPSCAGVEIVFKCSSSAFYNGLV